jgi:hypothetical protein
VVNDTLTVDRVECRRFTRGETGAPDGLVGHDRSMYVPASPLAASLGITVTERRGA